MERYRVQGTRALRLGPLAETLDGFIDEWLGIEDGEAIRFGSPATATQHLALRTRRSEEWYSFTDAAECPGTPPTHQVRALWDKSKRTTYFRVSGDTAATLRMESVTDSPIPGCRSSRLDDIHERMRLTPRHLGSLVGRFDPIRTCRRRLADLPGRPALPRYSLVGDKSW